MRVVLSTIGKFHTFDLARQLERHGVLTAVFTGYPRFKLKQEELPASVIRSFPWIQTLYMGREKLGLRSDRQERQIAYLSNRALDLYTAACLPECDVFVGLANASLKTGRKARSRGSVYVCDRPVSHIRYQDNLLREEYDRQGMPFAGEHPRILEREQEEYATADAIVVGSSYAGRSFGSMGFPEEKVHLVPYGVDLSRFYPDGSPDPDHFDVLFAGSASVRKGIPYLLEAFAEFAHPRKRLTLVGTVRPELLPLIGRYAENHPITLKGHLPQPELRKIMSRSHVMVLPSIDEGLAMVQAQALACGCPVIGTTNSGAEDLFQDGTEGFVLPIRDSRAIVERLELLASDEDMRACMGERGLLRVRGLGGWDAYGNKMMTLFEQLLAGNSR